MQRDMIKTLVGLVIIGAIVVGTFLYGNAQRQAQINHDTAVKQQAAKSVAQSKSATPVPAATAAPTTPQVAVNTNTSPVKSPTSNSIQGSTQQGATLGANTAASPTPTPATTPAPVAGNSNLPATGPGTTGVIGFAAIALMLIALRGSRKSLVAAARSHK